MLHYKEIKRFKSNPNPSSTRITGAHKWKGGNRAQSLQGLQMTSNMFIITASSWRTIPSNPKNPPWAQKLQLCSCVLFPGMLFLGSVQILPQNWGGIKTPSPSAALFTGKSFYTSHFLPDWKCCTWRGVLQILFPITTKPQVAWQDISIWMQII